MDRPVLFSGFPTVGSETNETFAFVFLQPINNLHRKLFKIEIKRFFPEFVDFQTFPGIGMSGRLFAGRGVTDAYDCPISF